ncbi:MAG: hypothetical protein K9N35_04960 [Candidatus Marinimicrobia bacterium]|nr:hypothetical protein [Candidatus Neomarinimicrobiota bacterium]
MNTTSSSLQLGYDKFENVPNDIGSAEVFSFTGNLKCPHCGILLLDAQRWDPEKSMMNAGVGDCPHLLYAFALDREWRAPEFLSVRTDYAKAYVAALVISPQYSESLFKWKLSPLKGREIAEFGSGDLKYSTDFEDYPTVGHRVAQCGWHLPSVAIPEVLPNNTIIFVTGKSTTIHFAICPSVEDTVKLP